MSREIDIKLCQNYTKTHIYVRFEKKGSKFQAEYIQHSPHRCIFEYPS